MKDDFSDARACSILFNLALLEIIALLAWLLFC